MNVLEQFENNWVTEMGAWFQGERVVFRGRDLFTDLNESSWMKLLLFGITGRDFTENQVAFCERVWTLCTSYPESRLWNNRVAALAGSSRSTAALAIGAATAISEATLYGRRPDIRSIDFLFRAQQLVGSDGDLEQFILNEYKTYGAIMGYGRPLIDKDERIGPILKVAAKFHFDQGPYLRLAYQVEEIIKARPNGPRMNVAGVVAALMADIGLNAKEYYQLMVLSFSVGMFPCYIDALEKPEGAFFPIRCSQIQYLGKPPRAWRNI